MKRALVYGAAGGALITLLKVIEYQHFVHAYPGELYGGLVALIFTAVGVYVGLRWMRPKEVVVVQEVRVRDERPFAPDDERRKELAITPPRARDPRPDRRGAEQPRDRGAALRFGEHGQDAFVAPLRQARREPARPGGAERPRTRPDPLIFRKITRKDDDADGSADAHCAANRRKNQ